jgi:hypothetical protein
VSDDKGTVLVKGPSQRQVNIAAANIDRFIGVVEAHRDSIEVDPMSELVTIMYAAENFDDIGVRLMFAIMLQRLADQA